MEQIVDFEPTITVGNIIVAASIIVSVISAVVATRAKLDYLAAEFTRLSLAIEKLDSIVRNHEKYISILMGKLDIK
jgi:outer membrane murein-binding lipoprotein Lpp